MSKKKSLIINSLYSVAYKLLNVLFPLITAAYVSHVLMADGVGKVASAQNIVQYFVIVASLGIPTYGTREIAKRTQSTTEQSELFSELFLINLSSTLLCTIAYYITVLSFPFFKENSLLYIVVGVNIILEIGNVDWIYQGLEDFKYIALRSFVVKIFSLALLLIIVRNHNDCWQYALVSVLATAGNNIFNLLHLRKKGIHLCTSRINIRRHLKPVFILLCTSLSLELYTLLDTTMVTFFCASENVAYYNNAMKIVKMLITVITAICAVLLPRLSILVTERKYDEVNLLVNKVLSILLFIFVPCGIGIIFVADEFIPIMFGNSFEPAVITLQITALLIYTLGFSNLFGTQILMPFGCEKKLLLCTIIGAGTNILMNLILIPTYAQNGAAAASVASEGIVTIMTFLMSSKYVKYKLEKRFLVSTIIATIIMSLFLLIVEISIKQSWMNLSVSVFGGIIIYLIVNILLRNTIISDLVTLIHKKD